MAVFNHELLLRVRLDLGLTQEQAAEGLGVDVRTYRRYETGAVNEGGRFDVRHPTRRGLLRRLCQEFGVDDEAGWLMAGPGDGVDAAPGPPPAPPAPSPLPLASAPRHVHPLPRARHFTGRAALLDRLRSWDEDEGAPERVLCLVAVGGAGKTALVERF